MNKLFDLLSRFHSRDMDARSFADQFEQEFNETRNTLDNQRDVMYGRIFDKVVFLTDFPEEKKELYAGYVTEEELSKFIAGEFNEIRRLEESVG